MEIISAPEGCFFTAGGKVVRLTKEEIPEWYIYVRTYRIFGYLDSKNVKYLVYSPNYVTNHLYKDDFLYVSYKKPIVIDEDYYKNSALHFEMPVEDGKRQLFYTGYDFLMWGPDVVSFARGVKKYGNIDNIGDILARMEDKPRWFRENFPEEAKWLSI